MLKSRNFILIYLFSLIWCCLGTVKAQATHHSHSIAKIAVIQRHNNTDSAAYEQIVKQQLEHFWCPAKATKAHATVTFRINKDGRVSWVELTDAAADSGANLSVVDAVNYSSPFPAPPSSFIDIAAEFNSDFHPQFRFAYTRPPAGDLSTSARLYLSTISDRKSGHLENALHSMQQAYRLLPSNTRVRDDLIDLYIEYSRTKHGDQEMCLLRQALLLNPSNQPLRQRLNGLLISAGKNPASYDVRLRQARDYEKVCQYEDALCEYGESWLLKQDQSIIPEINLACKRRSNYADVCRWKDALKVADNPDYHTELGHAYEACDEPENAIAEYRTALKLNSAHRLAMSGLERLQSAAAAVPNNASGNNRELRDDFPYSKAANCTVSVTVVKNRKVSVDYLKAACGHHMTRWANNQTSFGLYVDDGQNTPGYCPGYRQLMINAFATWVKASENRLTYTVVNNPQEANIACYWVAGRTKDMKQGELGVTKWRALYHKNEPNLLMPQSAQVFILTLAPNSSKSISYTAMKAICLHELGHTLGITGHSPYPGDVMYATLSPYDIPNNLSDRDIATIKHLYQGYSHLDRKL